MAMTSDAPRIYRIKLIKERIMKKASIILATAVLSACGSVKLLSPTQADVDRMSDTYPDYTLAELTEGKALYQQKCDRCHGLKDPAAYSTAQWKEITPKMVEMANEREQIISTQEATLIQQYLVTMGR